MKKIYKLLSAAAIVTTSFCQDLSAQTGCAISATNNLYGWGCGYGDNIDDFELDGIANNSSGCSSNGYYTYYSAPAWTLQIGQTYTWQANVGSGFLYQGLAIWIDLDNDGTFTSSEQLANSLPDVYHTGSFQVPFSASSGAGHRMRIRCDYYGTIGNTNSTACEQYGPPNYNFYYGEMEDYDVYLLPAPPCSGTPASNNVVGPSESICPGTGAQLTLGTTYTVGDITYQWQASTQSSVGAWTNVGGNNMNYYAPSITANTWYQVIITCTNSAGSTIATVGLVEVQGTTIDSVYYLEDFEGISEENELPNCSWDATNLGSEAYTYTLATWDNRVPRSGDKFASFYYYPPSTNAFYTNGIHLNAGVVYSASVWYTTDLYGQDNWEDLSIMIGPGQSSSSQTVIASTPGPAISAQYKSLSNTFTVGSTGVYYVSVEATSNANSYAYYLSWDDLEISAPCSLNQPQVNVSTSTQTICAGEPVTINATGGDTYSWDTGDNSSAITANPQISRLFVVTATNSITGCSAQASQYITVNPTPFVGVVADKSKVCAGNPVNLTAVGNAANYSWSSGGGTGMFLTVVPNTTGAYAVQGSNSFGCTSTASIIITVNPNPLVNAAASNTDVCQDDNVTLTGSGAVNYQWLSNSSYIVSNPAVVSPDASTSYTLIGTDANGCTGEDYIALNVNVCSGLTESGRLAGVRVFPNPGTGLYTVQLPGNVSAEVKVIDIVGRVVFTNASALTTKTVDITGLANGVYYFTIRTGDSTEVVRVIKD